MQSLYFNEFERFAAAWLRDLWPEAHVDERSITDVAANDVRGFERVHLFGGIGGWEYALELAGWPAKRPVWTGSCPCQPFSSAGRRKGKEDERHLWPEMSRLIRECRPPVVFGEQVESAVRHGWLDGVFADLEAEGYACGAVVLGAHSVGAPHIRQRLFWVANAGQQLPRNDISGINSEADHTTSERRPEAIIQPAGRSGLGGLADVQEDGRGQGSPHFRGINQGIRAEGHWRGPADNGRDGRLGNSNGIREGAVGRVPAGAGVECEGVPVGLGVAGLARLEGHGGHVDDGSQSRRIDAEPAGSVAQAGAVGDWDRFELVHCLDGKARRIEPGTFPLAHGVSNRVGRLRGYGNAIVPQAASEFIRAFLWAESALSKSL